MDDFECVIESVAYGGDGIARVDGRVVFIPGVIAGERVRAGIVLAKKNFARGELLEVLQASPDRISPCCRTRAGDRVPGCVYDHIAYSAQVALKADQLRNFFRRMPLEASVFQTPVASPKPLHYRNKITLHTDSVRRILGYCEDRSHRVIPIEACPLACEEINAAPRPSAGQLSGVEDVVFRFTRPDGVAIFLKRFGKYTLQRFDQPAKPGNLNEQGPDGTLWSVPSDGFFQVNPSVSWSLVDEVVKAFLSGSDETCASLADLYCGVGVFGLSCLRAHPGTRLVGVESGLRAIEAARVNAGRLGLAGTDFRVGELGRGAQFPAACSTVIVDPPREGLEKSLAFQLAKSGAKRIFYVSCDPATLLRDLGILTAEGAYRVTSVRLFDLFPQTAHFETLVLLEAKG